MSGILERLVEYWLDSASERSYQAAFCQLLAGQGHRVVHSTRHTALEFGKDVISVDSDGVACAYQLKGNPGSRLSKSQYQEILPQLRELIFQPLSYPGIPATGFRAYLVTNGNVEEEVLAALAALEIERQERGAPARSIELIQRGTLLDWAVATGVALWPAEIEKVDLLMRLLVASGEESFLVSEFDQLLLPLLRLRKTDNIFKSKAQLRRSVASAAILTGIAASKYAAAKNHVALASAWSMCASYIIAAATRHSAPAVLNLPVLALAIEESKLALEDLTREVVGDDVAPARNLLAEVVTRGVRHTTVAGYVGLYSLWCEGTAWRTPELRTSVADWLAAADDGLDLWGEGAVPAILLFSWARERLAGGADADHTAIALLRTILLRNRRASPAPLAGPYCSAIKVIRQSQPNVFGPTSLYEREVLAPDSSYFARSLFELAAAGNWKQNCRVLWPELSRFVHLEFCPKDSWGFCLRENDEGENRIEVPEPTAVWGELVDRAMQRSGTSLPAGLRDRPALAALLVLSFPYRGTADAIRFLAGAFSTAWRA